MVISIAYNALYMCLFAASKLVDDLSDDFAGLFSDDDVLDHFGVERQLVRVHITHGRLAGDQVEILVNVLLSQRFDDVGNLTAV